VSSIQSNLAVLPLSYSYRRVSSLPLLTVAMPPRLLSQGPPTVAVYTVVRRTLVAPLFETASVPLLVLLALLLLLLLLLP
jgi:hypothetical protein